MLLTCTVLLGGVQLYPATLEAAVEPSGAQGTTNGAITTLHAISGKVEGNVIELKLNQLLTNKGQDGQFAIRELQQGGILVHGLASDAIQSVYASGASVYLVMNQSLVAVDHVDIQLAAGVISAVEGGSNPLINYRIVTRQGELKLLDTLDPERKGFGMKEVVKLLNVLKPDNIVGKPGIDSEDARYLLSIMETTKTDTGESKVELQLLAETAERLLGETMVLSNTTEWGAVQRAMSAALSMINDAVSNRQISQATQQLLRTMDDLRFGYHDERNLPDAVSLEAEGLIADHRFDAADLEALQAGGLLQFVVELPAREGLFHHYEVGDRLVIWLGADHETLSYTLTGADIARLNQSSQRITVDGKALFAGNGLQDGSVEPRVCVLPRGATAEDCGPSAGTGLSGNPELVIDRFSLKLVASASGTMLVGSSPTFTSNKSGYLYLAYAGAGDNEYMERQEIQAGVPAAFDLGDYSEGTRLRVYATDQAGNRSPEQHIIYLTLAVLKNGSDKKIVVDDNTIYADETLRVGELLDALETVGAARVLQGDVPLGSSGRELTISEDMQLEVGGTKYYWLQPVKVVSTIDELERELDGWRVSRTIYLNASMTDASYLFSVVGQVKLISSRPVSLEVNRFAFDGGNVEKVGPITLIAHVEADNSQEGDRELSNALADSPADIIKLRGVAGHLLDGFEGELLRKESMYNRSHFFVSRTGHAFVASGDEFMNALQDKSVKRIYLTGNIEMDQSIEWPDRALDLSGRNRELRVHGGVSGTLQGTTQGVTIVE